MTNLTQTLTEFFKTEEWDFQIMEAAGILRMAFSGDAGNWSCLAQAREQQQQIAFYSICPLVVPEPRRLAMAEFLTRANYGLVIGNFELDLDDGEVRFKTSLDLEEVDLGAEGVIAALLRHVVYANVTAMDRYLPGILVVIADSRTPAQAVADIDGSHEPDLSKS